MLLRAFSPSHNVERTLLSETFCVTETGENGEQLLTERSLLPPPRLYGTFSPETRVRPELRMNQVRQFDFLESKTVEFTLYQYIYDHLHGIEGCFVYGGFFRDFINRNNGNRKFNEAMGKREIFGGGKEYENPLIHRKSYFNRVQSIQSNFDIFYEGNLEDFFVIFNKIFSSIFTLRSLKKVEHCNPIIEQFYSSNLLLCEHTYTPDHLDRLRSCLVQISVKTRKKGIDDKELISKTFKYPWSFSELMCDGYNGKVGDDIHPPQIDVPSQSYLLCSLDYDFGKVDTLQTKSDLLKLHVNKITLIPMNINTPDFMNCDTQHSHLPRERFQRQLREYVMIHVLQHQYNKGWYVINSPFRVVIYLTRASVSPYYAYMFRNRRHNSQSTNGESACVICMRDFDEFEKVVHFNHCFFCYDCMKSHICNTENHNYEEDNNTWKIRCARGSWQPFIHDRTDTQNIKEAISFLRKHKTYCKKYISNDWSVLSICKDSPEFTDVWSLQWRNFSRQLIAIKRLHCLLDYSMEALEKPRLLTALKLRHLQLFCSLLFIFFFTANFF